MSDDLVIKFDNSQVRTAVEDAILRSLDAETQKTLIRDALSYLTRPREEHNRFGSKNPTTPLSEAFQRHVTTVVEQIAQSLLAEHTPLRAELDALIEEQLRKFITENSYDFTLALGRGIADALQKREDR